jgi:hypothetical protein
MKEPQEMYICNTYPRPEILGARRDLSWDLVDPDRMTDTLWYHNHHEHTWKDAYRYTLTPCFFPITPPITVNGALIRNHSRTTKSMVPKGTAPEESAEIRKRFKRNMTMKINLSPSVINVSEEKLGVY